MVSFLSLLHLLNLPFSLDLLYCFFFIHVMKTNDFICVGTGQKSKLIAEILRKFEMSKGDYLFVSIPDNFPLPSCWKDL